MKTFNINTEKQIYNGYSIRQILAKMPKNMLKIHKILYIKNCIEVYNNEKHNVNLGLCELIRNSNFMLINMYL